MKPKYKLAYLLITAAACAVSLAAAQEPAAPAGEGNGQQPAPAAPAAEQPAAGAVSGAPGQDPAAAPAPAATEQTPAAAETTPPPATPQSMDIDTLKQAAGSGDAEAQTELAERYFTGKDVSIDIMLGIQQLSFAVQKNNPKAQTMLGACYYSGTGVSQDYLVALEWFTKAASSGYAPAQLCLYAAYRDGRGVPADAKVAMQWLEKAMAQKSTDAMCEMALIKLRGALGTQQNIEAARAILEEAKALGSSQAVQMLNLLDEAFGK